MLPLTKNALAFTLLCLATVLFSGCGNKGDLYLDSNETLVETLQTIDDALDELEAMEAEEEDGS